MTACHKDDDHCPHAEEAAEQAVAKVFAILGVDIKNPHQVEEFREDLRFGARVRRTADRMWYVIWGCAAAAIVYALWDGIRHKLGQ